MAPARVGPVRDHTHYRVVDSVPDAADQEQCGGHAGRDQEHVGVKVGEIQHKGLPVEHRREIAEPIGHFFL